MEKTEFIEQLKALTAQEDLLAVSREVNELKAKFEDFCIEEERLKQVAFLEAQEKGEATEEERVPDPLKDEFYQIYSTFRDQKTAVSTAQKLEHESNLRHKRSLIDRLKTLISEEENIGVAVGTYKEIHEAWKQVGDIAREKRQEIQAEYSKLLESFFHNLKIYRELKEHDLKRNFQIKTEIVEKIKALHTHESIKEIEASIKALQNEFDETGPVPQEEWENVKTAYWDAVKAIYARIHDFYEVKREELRGNIEKKQELLNEVTAFIAGLGEITSTKEWEEHTQVLLKHQDAWKHIGFGTKKENEELWVAFRQQCDVFFARKKAFFEGLRSQFDEVAAAKKKLVDTVVSLKDSTEWKAVTEKIVQLQQDWKKLGNAGQRNEQSLWKEFRGACDAFFNAKQKHFEESDKLNEINLAAKLDIIAKIEAYEAPESKKQALDDLKEFSSAFNAVGKVPFKEKDKVYNAYKTAIDAHYTKLKLEGAEKDKAMFQSRMDSMKANPNADKMLDRERRDMQLQIQTLKQDILQYENNLGFFARSKGADALKKEVESKINGAKRKIEDYQRKIKLLANE
jgi:hypothetical protein